MNKLHHILNCSKSNDGADAFAKDDDSPDVIEDGEAQEASVALVEDWSTMLQLTWSPRGRRAVCLVSTCVYQDQD